MALPPITIPDLDPVSVVDPENDYLVIRQGLNDRRATPRQVSKLELGVLDPLPGPVLRTDRIIVGRDNGDGTYTNYIASGNSIGFLTLQANNDQTVMWFFSANAPDTWVVLPQSRDRVLATKSNNGPYSVAGVLGDTGNWQQEDHVLTVDEIPPHRHVINVSLHSSDTQFNEGYPRKGKDDIAAIKPLTESTGGGLGHNHGKDWRPLAAVGLLCRKTG